MVENNYNKKTSNKKITNSKDIKKSNKKLKKDVKKSKNGKKKGKVKKIILITFLVLFLLGIIATGATIGIVVSTFKEDWVINKDDLVITGANSTVVDKDGKVLAVLTGDEARQPITLDKMTEYLPKAYVAIEDERFHEHLGIDFKRTLGAVLSYVTGNSSYGGSTITQQVVKNLTKDDDRSVERKIKEWGRAYNLENLISKDQILEIYLNLIYVGGPAGQGLYGVEMASLYYFNKSASELSLAECAYLAGINSSPNYYRPFDDLDKDGNMPEEMKNRIDTKIKIVLNKMKETGAITNEQDYIDAMAQVEEGIKFKKGTVKTDVYSFHTEDAINEVVEDYMEKNGVTEAIAKNYIFSNGLTIHTTQDTDIQGKMEKEYKDKDNLRTSKKTKDKDGKYVTSQSAMVIIDQETGYVVGAVGQFGEKTVNGNLNRVNTLRSTGSSMKPLAILVPGLQEGIITAGTVYDDVPTSFGNVTPKNHYAGYKGLSTIRYVFEISQNIIPAKLYHEIGGETIMSYMDKLGLTTIDKEKDDSHSLALGGLTYGVSVLEMAGAYATIANDGVYIEPTFYTKVVDEDKNVILESEQESHRVMSEQNAYVAKEVLTAPVTGTSGAATAWKTKVAGIETAAKTGTTDGDKDRWLCGFTPYYTAAVWYGFDQQEYIPASINPGTIIFSDVMNAIHKPLPNASFERPEGITQVKICKDSGMLPGENCSHAINGDRVYPEYFVRGTAPTKKCDVHVTAKVCPTEKSTKKNPQYELSNGNCPDEVELTFITRKDRDKNKAWEKAADAKFMLPTKVCTRHTEDPTVINPVITLNGEAKIQLEIGATYVELGAKALDAKDGDVTNNMIITGTVDTSKVGIYIITYTVEDLEGNKVSTTREVTVTEKVEDKTAPTLTIIGASIIELEVGETYKDLGATAIDNIDGDITKNIIVTGTVNTAVVGTYTITYTIEDAAKNKTTKTRKIIIKEEDVDTSGNNIVPNTNTVKYNN